LKTKIAVPVPGIENGIYFMKIDGMIVA